MSTDLRFDNGATDYGTFIIDEINKLGSIFGEIRSKSNNSKGFNVTITLTDMVSIPVNGGKRELKPVGGEMVYTDLGGTLVDTSTWIGYR